MTENKRTFRRLMPHSPSLIAAAAAAMASLAASAARADVASWVYVGGGATQLQMTGQAKRTQAALQIDAGFGSNPNDSVVFGGVLRTFTQFDAGTDWVIAQRTTSGGFSRGDWGLALDLGGYQRWWGAGSTGFMGTLWAGGPWGLQLGATAAIGTEKARTFGLTLGIDWARATAHRHSGQSWWRNYVLPLDRDRR